MTINAPKIMLTFSDEAIVSLQQEITDMYIVRGSVKFRMRLLDGLMSSSDQVSLQLTRDCQAIGDIIKAIGDISAVFKDGDQTLFSGYISTNHSWSVTEHGEQSFNITLEGVGTRLLALPFISSGYQLFDCTADSALRAICASVGITVSPTVVELSERILGVVEASKTCRDILSKLVYELGYVYIFDNLGRLTLFKIDCTSVAGIRTLDGDDLVCVSKKAVSLSKSIRQYDSSHVTFVEIARVSDYLVYRNTTGQDTGHPYCNLELPSGSHFDGTEIYTAEQWTAELADEFREPALIGSCNAASETEYVGSNEIIAVSNVRCVSEKQTGITCSITAAGGPYLSINVHNSAPGVAQVRRLDAYGDIVYQKSTGIVRGGSGGNVISENLEFVHDRTLAQRHANLLSDYHRYCSSKYTFCLREDIALGTIVRLHDNVFSGLDVNVILVAKEFSDSSDVVSYTAVGISVFDLNRELYHRTTDRQRLSNKGKDGLSFTVTIESSDGSVYRPSGNLNITLNCKVFCNTIDITDSLEDWQFHWYRKSGDASGDESWNTSSKAIGHKSVHITNEDVYGRSVFSCEVELGEAT